METILTGSSYVDRQGLEKHTAKSGKIKDVLKGIPSKAFWYLWKIKANKEAFKKLGLTLWAERSKGATGEHKTHKGRSKAVTRKQWEITIWLNRRNRPLLAEAGYTVYESPEQIETNGNQDDPF